jgi:L-ascorbate metabolism protein UlaG (beta-lactamase superfamily)
VPTPLDRIGKLGVGPGIVAPWWLGQAGFIVRGHDTAALVDPFLSPHEGRL